MAKYLLLLVFIVSAVKADASISNYFRQLLENLRPMLRIRILDLNIPPMDPLSIPEISTKIKDSKSDINLKIRNLQVCGLSTFTVDRIDSSLSDMSLSIRASFDQVNANGWYDLKGRYHSFPLFGNDRAFLQVKDIVVQASASLLNTNGTLQFRTFNITEVQVGGTKVHLENLSGPSDLGVIVNTLVDSLGVRLLHLIRPLVIKEVGGAVFDLVNRELGKISIEDINAGVLPPMPYRLPYSDNSNEYVDHLLANVRQTVVDNNLDPLPLPDLREGFRENFLIFTVYGEAKLYNGRLSGLGTIYRSSNANLQVDGQTIVLSTELGFRRLAASYTGSATFLDVGPTIRATVYVDGVIVNFKAGQSLTPGAGPNLMDFRISSVGYLSVRIDGLGPLGSILGTLTGIISNLIKGVIIKQIEGPISQIIRNELSKISILL